MSLENPSRPAARGHAAGAIAAAMAFVLWGALPLYWKTLKDVGAVEIIAHRVVWSLAFTGALVTGRRLWGQVFRAIRSWRAGGMLALSASLLSLNWLTYVWGVNSGQVLETSLGYFVTPLASVALGVIFLRERLRPAQIAAFLLAGGGVVWEIAVRGRLPWIAMALAVTFGFYGLLRKTAALESLPGLAAETAMLTVPAGIYLAALFLSGGGAVGRADWQTHLLLAGTGLVTAVPLLLFAYGARRIRLTTVGVLQYLSPTGTFLLGALVFKEPFDRQRLVTFVLVWIALAIYAAEGLLRPAKSRCSPSAGKVLE